MWITNLKILTTNITFFATIQELQEPFVHVDLPDLVFFLIERGHIDVLPLWVDYLFLFYFVFLIGLLGMVFNYKNFLVTMFSIEIMYLGITICFVIVSISTADPKGQIYAILLLVLAAAESAIGLGILIVLYRLGSSINFQDYGKFAS